MNPNEAAAALAKALTTGDTPQAYADLYRAFQVASYSVPALPSLQEQLKSYSLVAYYYAFVKDRKRLLRGGEKLAYQFWEDHMEGVLKALDKGIISTMHLSNLTGRHQI